MFSINKVFQFQVKEKTQTAFQISYQCTLKTAKFQCQQCCFSAVLQKHTSLWEFLVAMLLEYAMNVTHLLIKISLKTLAKHVAGTLI